MLSKILVIVMFFFIVSFVILWVVQIFKPKFDPNMKPIPVPPRPPTLAEKSEVELILARRVLMDKRRLLTSKIERKKLDDEIAKIDIELDKFPLPPGV